jgi:hypothetical protein
MRSTRDWSPMRWKAHQAAFPPEEKGERNRKAQADYRARNRIRIKAANKIRAIVVRQTWNHGDEEKIAQALKLLLSPEGIAEVVKALTAPVVAGGKTRTTATTSKEASTTKVALETPFEACITLFRAPVKDAAAEMLRYNTYGAVEIAKAILAKFATFSPRDTVASSSPASVSAGGSTMATAKKGTTTRKPKTAGGSQQPHHVAEQDPRSDWS